MQQSNSDEHPNSHMKEESCFWVLTPLSKTLVFVRLFRICDSGLLSLLNISWFQFQVEKQEFGLKPMNCPGHCLIFDHRVRSYRGQYK